MFGTDFASTVTKTHQVLADNPDPIFFCCPAYWLLGILPALLSYCPYPGSPPNCILPLLCLPFKMWLWFGAIQLLRTTSACPGGQQDVAISFCH